MHTRGDGALRKFSCSTQLLHTTTVESALVEIVLSPVRDLELYRSIISCASFSQLFDLLPVTFLYFHIFLFI